MTPTTAASPGRLGRLRRDFGRSETRWAFAFLLPWIIGFIIFTGGPMIASLVFSFTNLGLRPSFDFVGTANYARMLSDPRVVLALQNTAFYTILHLPPAVTVALPLARKPPPVGWARA